MLLTTGPLFNSSFGLPIQTTKIHQLFWIAHIFYFFTVVDCANFQEHVNIGGTKSFVS